MARLSFISPEPDSISFQLATPSQHKHLMNSSNVDIPALLPDNDSIRSWAFTAVYEFLRFFTRFFSRFCQNISTQTAVHPVSPVSQISYNIRTIKHLTYNWGAASKQRGRNRDGGVCDQRCYLALVVLSHAIPTKKLAKALAATEQSRIVGRKALPRCIIGMATAMGR